LILGIVVIGVVVLMHPPGPDALREALSPERLTFRGEGEGIFARMEAWAVPIAGSLFAQELVTRALAARSQATARNACIAGGAIYLMVGLVPLALGLVGPALVPGLEDPERLLPELGQRLLPTGLYIMFAGAVVSAILSTVDSTLLASASLVSHNVLGRIRPNASERVKVRTARGCVAAFGAIAYLFALRSERVYELVEDASSFGSAGLFVAVVLGFWTKWGREAAGFCALAGGLGGFLVFKYAVNAPTPFLASMACALAGFVLGAAWSGGRARESSAVEVT
jgi:Na+/proline symporter